ncbi:hypothetical protein BRADI_3g47946v3 [Brachypodium distachyon]|uniref:Uncharacterized protein n=1 Tax=Brachypodium distachyon TaxID=15368 RepID=A0A2K2D3X0_BRADI|nr:hypothetical protein BRADI_3g47946v3 [Brachypodium distachyon]
MAPKRMFLPARNDHETELSSGAHNRRPATPFRLTPARRSREGHMNIDVRKAAHYWDHGILLLWPDVHLPHGWHLNPERVPVPPVLASGHARQVEIWRRRSMLPDDPAYAEDSSYWDQWFETEHDMHRRSFFAVVCLPPPPSLSRRRRPTRSLPTRRLRRRRAPSRRSRRCWRQPSRSQSGRSQGVGPTLGRRSTSPNPPKTTALSRRHRRRTRSLRSRWWRRRTGASTTPIFGVTTRRR